MILAPPRFHLKVIPKLLSEISQPGCFFLGRLFQIEYAMEAISHAGTCLGIVSNEGIILGAEKRIVSKLLDPRQSQEKIFRISEYERWK